MNNYSTSTLFSVETKSHGRPDIRLVKFAFNFLFPGEARNKEKWESFLNFVNERYDLLGCAVIWQKTKLFDVEKVGKKEVIITGSSVMTTKDSHYRPFIAYRIPT